MQAAPQKNRRPCKWIALPHLRPRPIRLPSLDCILHAPHVFIQGTRMQKPQWMSQCSPCCPGIWVRPPYSAVVWFEHLYWSYYIFFLPYCFFYLILWLSFLYKAKLSSPIDVHSTASIIYEALTYSEMWSSFAEWLKWRACYSLLTNRSERHKPLHPVYNSSKKTSPYLTSETLIFFQIKGFIL